MCCGCCWRQCAGPGVFVSCPQCVVDVVDVDVRRWVLLCHALNVLWMLFVSMCSAGCCCFTSASVVDVVGVDVQPRVLLCHIRNVLRMFLVWLCRTECCCVTFAMCCGCCWCQCSAPGDVVSRPKCVVDVVSVNLRCRVLLCQVRDVLWMLLVSMCGADCEILC